MDDPALARPARPRPSGGVHGRAARAKAALSLEISKTDANDAQGLGGVFIHASHAMAQASATKGRNEVTVFSQRKAMRRKRLMGSKKHSTRWRS